MGILDQINEDFRLNNDSLDTPASLQSVENSTHPNVVGLLSVYTSLNYDYIEDEVSEKKSAITYEEIIEKYRVNYGEVTQDETPAIEIISSETGEGSILGTLGNISMIKGKAKSRKTFLVNLIISSVLSNRENNRIRGAEIVDKKMLYFDTEQGRGHVTKAQNSIIDGARTEGDIDSLLTLSFRELTPYERIEYIDLVVKNSDDIGLIVIDGIKDLVTSINDEKESTTVTSKLLQWSTKYNCHIIVILHENPTNDKSRGHIGTELTNKAETIIQVEVDSKNPEVSIVRPSSCRNIPFEEFAFSVDEDGIPFIVKDYVIKSKKVNKKSVMEIDDSEKYELLQLAFDNKEFLGYGELESRIKSVVNDKGFKKVKYSSNASIKKFIPYSRDHSLLIQEGNNKPYRLNHQFTNS